MRAVVLTLLGFALFCFLLQWVDTDVFLETLSGANWSLVGISLGLGAMTTLTRAARFCVFFGCVQRLALAYGAFGVLRGIQYVLPFRGGELVALPIFKKLNLVPSIAECVPVWFLFRLSELAAVGTLFFAICLIDSGLMRSVSDSPLLWSGVVILVWTVIAVSPHLTVLALQHSKISGQIGTSVILKKLEDGLHRIQGWKTLVTLHASSFVIWLSNIACLTVALVALDPPLSSLNSAMVITGMLGIGLLPIRAPMGVGTGDASLVAMLRLYGIPLSYAVALALGVRVLQMLVVFADTTLGAGILVLMNKQRLSAK